MLVYGIKDMEKDSLVYIGQTIRSLSHRWTQHLRDARKLDYPIYRAIRKYGQSRFEIVELARAQNREELNSLEKDLIKKFNTLTPNGYNLMLGQSGGEHSVETKEKIKVAAIKNGFGKWQRSEEDNLKNKERVLKQHSDPVKRERFLKANGSREFNVFEAIQTQIRAPGRPNLYEKGKLVGTWLSSIDCAKELKLQASNVRNCLLGIKKSHKGLMFEYKEKWQ